MIILAIFFISKISLYQLRLLLRLMDHTILKPCDPFRTKSSPTSHITNTALPYHILDLVYRFLGLYQDCLERVRSLALTDGKVDRCTTVEALALW